MLILEVLKLIFVCYPNNSLSIHCFLYLKASLFEALVYSTSQDSSIFYRSVGSKKAETASTIMSFFLSSGLTTGALLSFVMLVIMGVDIIS